MASTGFYNYFQNAGLDSGIYLVHFDFNSTGANGTFSSAPQTVGGFNATVNPIGNFFAYNGSGQFTGQKLTINNWTGVDSSSWTQIFIYQSSGQKGGLLFDSFQTGEINSGYKIGVNDNNKLYFEYYTEQGYTSRTSNVMYGNKNAVAVIKNSNAISFYCYDFNAHSFRADGFAVNNTYIQPSTKAIIGEGFSGYLDEYVYLSKSVSSVTLSELFSGFYSSIQLNSGTVSGFQTNEITGYINQVTGLTGITGYQVTQVSSGLDPFGDPIYSYTTSGVTGYFSSGIRIIPQTGLINNYITGDPFVSVNVDVGFVSGFGLNEVSYIRNIQNTDYSYLKTVSNTGLNIFNKLADYDSIYGQFELDSVYAPNQISVFINGIAQLNLGSSITGNYYNSGVSLSGDYVTYGFRVNSTGFYLPSDTLIFDVASGVQNFTYTTGNSISGKNENLSIVSNQLIYLNGSLLSSGVDYISNAGQFTWNTNLFSGCTGILFSLNYFYNNYSEYAGRPIIPITNFFSRSSSQFYLNGQRQTIGLDYLENSSLDLIRQSGIFDANLNSVYNDNDAFFEAINGTPLHPSFDSIFITFDETTFTFDRN